MTAAMSPIVVNTGDCTHLIRKLKAHATPLSESRSRNLVVAAPSSPAVPKMTRPMVAAASLTPRPKM
jgi:hypothetical protein